MQSRARASFRQEFQLPPQSSRTLRLHPNFSSYLPRSDVATIRIGRSTAGRRCAQVGAPPPAGDRGRSTITVPAVPRHGDVIPPGKDGRRVEPRTPALRERCGQTEQGAGDERQGEPAPHRERPAQTSLACVHLHGHARERRGETSERIVAGDVVEPEPLGAHQPARERPGRGDQPADLARSRLRLGAARISARSGADPAEPDRVHGQASRATYPITISLTLDYPAPSARAAPAGAPWRDGPPGRPVFCEMKAESVAHATK